MLSEIVRAIVEKSFRGPDLAVYLSGGLDSTIMLHHLLEKYEGDVHTCARACMSEVRAREFLTFLEENS